jgi:hypothetical protein
VVFKASKEQPQPFERHFTPHELAHLWRLDVGTVRRLFQDEPDVLKVGETGRRGKRDYVTLGFQNQRLLDSTERG